MYLLLFVEFVIYFAMHWINNMKFERNVLQRQLNIWTWTEAACIEITSRMPVIALTNLTCSFLQHNRKETSYNDRRFWCSYILFIIIIGAILVLFIYITRLASNEIFSSSNKIHREVGRAKDLSAPRYFTSCPGRK